MITASAAGAPRILNHRPRIFFSEQRSIFTCQRTQQLQMEIIDHSRARGEEHLPEHVASVVYIFLERAVYVFACTPPLDQSRRIQTHARHMDPGEALCAQVQ